MLYNINIIKHSYSSNFNISWASNKKVETANFEKTAFLQIPFFKIFTHF